MPSKHDRVESWPDDRLLREANNGNDAAFRQFCVRTIPSLLRYCEFHCRQLGIDSKKIGVDSRAADFCQDAIHQALTDLKSCYAPGGKQRPRVSVAWLKEIAYNRIIDWHRRERRVRLVGDFVGHLERESPVDTTVDEIEEQEQILKFFDWLQGNDRDMLELVLVKELGIVEAGEQLGLSPDASYKAYQRALQRLQDLLVEHGYAAQFADPD